MGKPTKIYRQVIKQSAPITGVRVTSSLVQPLIALILPAQLIASGYTSTQAMSLYGVAVGMTLPFLFLPSALIGSLATALVPDISMALAENDKEHIQKRIESSVIFALFVSFLIVPIFVAIGDKFGLFIYNNALSGTLLQFSAWIMIPMGITNITSSLLNSVGLEVKSFINYIIGGLFMFICILFLPKLIGINALIVGMGISNILSSFLNLRMLKKKLGIKINILKKLLLLILLALPTVAITAFLSGILSHFMPMFFDLVISTFVGILIFVLLCAIFNLLNFSMYFIKIKEKFASKIETTKLKNKKKIIKKM